VVSHAFTHDAAVGKTFRRTHLHSPLKHIMSGLSDKTKRS
jgi:hypothetical protein